MKKIIVLFIVLFATSAMGGDFAKLNGETLIIQNNVNDPIKQSKMRNKGYLPYVDAEKPIYDPDTHYIVKQGYTIGETQITRNWAVYERTEEDKKRIADAKLKAADILANLPPWAQVETAINNISNLEEAKVFLKKLARVVYWNTKNTSE